VSGVTAFIATGAAGLLFATVAATGDNPLSIPVIRIKSFFSGLKTTIPLLK
jgi:hypothetical protein